MVSRSPLNYVSWYWLRDNLTSSVVCCKSSHTSLDFRRQPGTGFVTDCWASFQVKSTALQQKLATELTPGEPVAQACAAGHCIHGHAVFHMSCTSEVGAVKGCVVLPAGFRCGGPGVVPMVLGQQHAASVCP